MRVAGLGSGEAECLALAERIKADAVLVDEKKARRMASSRGFRVVGTVGVVLRGLESGTVGRTEVPAIIEEWKRINFRLSRELIELLRG